MRTVAGLIPTNEAKIAVKKIENAVKRIAYDPMSSLERTPAKDILERRNYMQSPEFWSDPENAKIWDLSQKVIEARDFATRTYNNQTGVYVNNKICRQYYDGFITDFGQERSFINSLGHRMTPPDLSMHNVQLFKAKALLHNQILKNKGEDLPLWCWRERINDF